MEVLGKGIIQYVSSKRIIASIGNQLTQSFDGGRNWEPWYTIPVSKTDAFLSSSRLLSRLSRREVNHIRSVGSNQFVCFSFGDIYLIDDNERSITRIGKIEGSRPLSICVSGCEIYYGLYGALQDFDTVPLYCYSLNKKEWSEYYKFKKIRHIHGVFWDPFESKLWVTTGDNDAESMILFFDGNDCPEVVVEGSQQARAVTLLFTEDYIFFATDAPQKQNYIYRIERASRQIEKLQAVGGPVFWGRKVGESLFFSTVVEPSHFNKTDKSELWQSFDDGNSWQKVLSFKRSFLNGKLFQYGQLRFPNGSGDGKHLYFSSYATKQDNTIMKVDI